MPRLVLVLAALWVLFAPEGASDGRRGNELYRQGQFEEAAATYQAGLDALAEGDAPAVRAALWNNLGLARFRQENAAGAQEAFEQARAAAPTNAAYANASYNAGNVAAASDARAEALRFFEEALLADPTHANARFNYEFLKRQMQQNPQQNQNQPPPNDIQPSAYAQRLKEQADSLVAGNAYAPAARLMQQGLRRDSTVAAFRDFITRTSEVAQIDSPDAANPNGNAIRSQ